MDNFVSISKFARKLLTNRVNIYQPIYTLSVDNYKNQEQIKLMLKKKLLKYF